MRILMIQTFYYYRGGDSTYMFNLTKLLEGKGHSVIPFAMEHPQNLPSPHSGHFVSEIDFPSLLSEFSPLAAWKVVSRSIYSREARKKIDTLIDEVKPDIAHIQNIHGHITTSIALVVCVRKSQTAGPRKIARTVVNTQRVWECTTNRAAV